MISKKIKDVLKIICKKSSREGIDWVLVGSANSAIQGVDVTAHDIDILTDKKGAFLISKLLKDYEIKSVEYKKSEKYASYFGQFRIKGVNVEVMGELEIKRPKGVWYKKPLIKKIIKVDEIRVPVNPLEEELAGYKASERVKKVGKIKEALNIS